MRRRTLQLLSTVVVTLFGAAFFLLFPPWQIEHPSDPSLIVRSERHLIWNRPLHAHLDPIAIAIPIIAILVVAIAIVVVSTYQE
ncbi:MAG TPA: hypothetical protein VJT08_19995 [Terriglobales bacterium]|nr:hypothetical protein [Terriglobales bacterium]